MDKKTRDALKDWEELKKHILSSSPIDPGETHQQKLQRISRLENDPEAWFRYYSSDYCTHSPADFHINATKRVLENAEWYEVRAWARESAKSARVMMEVLYLTLTKKKKNVLLVSNSFDNAQRLLEPYKINLEGNNRLINDYGIQKTLGHWEAGEFTAAVGTSFRAIGAGQSPRGTRKEASRPDVILIDDIDTDEECRNSELIDKKIEWIEQALIPTRSADNPLLLIVCGNIIADHCCVKHLGSMADKFDIINIKDSEGNPTWSKNSAQAIARIERQISYDSFQKEYMNNPMTKGKVFRELTYAECPPMRTCDAVVIYADPAPSDKTGSNSSHKAVATVGKKGLHYYVYQLFTDAVNNAAFVEALYSAYDFARQEKADSVYCFIENNSLQDPFYQQLLKPMIREQGGKLGYMLPIKEDTRKKPDKFARIEANLEPLNRNGLLIFNGKEKDNPHFKRANKQFLAVSPQAKLMDAPDAVEGAVFILNNKAKLGRTTYLTASGTDRRY